MRCIAYVFCLVLEQNSLGQKVQLVSSSFLVRSEDTVLGDMGVYFLLAFLENGLVACFGALAAWLILWLLTRRCLIRPCGHEFLDFVFGLNVSVQLHYCFRGNPPAVLGGCIMTF